MARIVTTHKRPSSGDKLARFLQPPSARERAARAALAVNDLPATIGPCLLSGFGEKWVAVRCPQDLDHLMRKAGGLWESGSRRWLIERRRIGPLIRNLRRDTDPLFRQAGLDLDEGA